MTAIDMPDNWTTLVGPVAAREFDNADDCHKPALIEWAQNLHTLGDDEFLTTATTATTAILADTSTEDAR